MTETDFDTWWEEVRRTVVKLVDVLDAKPVDEELSNTEIRDKDGVVHDLAELVKSQCVIDTGVCVFMPIHDYCSFGGRWISFNGVYYNRPEDLAKLIREHMDDPDYTVSVRMFR